MSITRVRLVRSSITPDRRSRRAWALPAMLAAAGMVAGLVAAGPLSPPPGGVQSTYKTLNEVEPRIAINAANTPGDADSVYKISLPGSYYLTAQVTVLPGKIGIEVACDGVTIDLNGFRIAGYPGSLEGIKTTGANRQDFTVHNGTVGPLGGTGVSFGSGSAARGCRIDNLTVVDCGSNGIFVDDAALVSHCVVSGCTSQGIYAANNIRLSDCVVTRCGAGILLSNGGVVENCQVDANVGDGIQFAGPARLVGNLCFGNGAGGATGAGIHGVGGGYRDAVIENNQCTENDHGFWIEGAGALIIGNRCAGNDWVIAPGNIYGPIINRLNLNSLAVNGVSAPSVLTTADPHANFTY